MIPTTGLHPVDSSPTPILRWSPGPGGPITGSPPITPSPIITSPRTDGFTIGPIRNIGIRFAPIAIQALRNQNIGEIVPVNPLPSGVALTTSTPDNSSPGTSTYEQSTGSVPSSSQPTSFSGLFSNPLILIGIVIVLIMMFSRSGE